MEAYKLDDVDLGILSLLQKDGLMTHKEIAHKLNKTITPIARRIKKLNDLGYIKRTVALIDIHKIQRAFIAFPHILLTKQSDDVTRTFNEEVKKYPEVMECYQLTGHYDFMLKIMMPDMASYNEFLRDKLSKLPYVGSIQSFLVLSEVKHETAG